MTLTESIPVPYADWEYEAQMMLNRPFAVNVRAQSLSNGHMGTDQSVVADVVLLTVRYEVSEPLN